MNPSKTMLQLSEIAARIKEMRDIMGWSLEELSEKTEFSIDECIAYEGGNTDIPFSFIHKCALAFDVEMMELLEGRSARLSSYTVIRSQSPIGSGMNTILLSRISRSIWLPTAVRSSIWCSAVD